MCICENIPRERTGYVLSPLPLVKVAHSFHMDCPEHGIVDGGIREMRKVFKRAWLNPMQCMGILAITTAELIERHPGGQVALVEWVEWELFPEPLEQKEPELV